MNIKLIKNAIIYKAHLPSIDALAGHLADLPFQEMGNLDSRRAGFVPNATTNELVTPIEGGLSFSLRYDEKILPAAAVRTATVKKVKKIEQEEGRRIGRKELQSIRDDVLMSLLPRALVKTAVITCLYHAKEQLLIVPVSSKRLADIVVSALIKVVGSVKTETIHVSDIKHGLTTRLEAEMTRVERRAMDERAFDGFDLAGYCHLIKGKEKVSYDVESLGDVSASIVSRINTDFKVDKLELTTADIAFKLTSDFHFRSVKFAAEPEYEEAEEVDAAFVWRNEAAIQMMHLVDAVQRLVNLLEYKESEQDAA